MESLAWPKRYVIDPRKVKMKHDVDDIIGDVGDIFFCDIFIVASDFG